MKACYGFLLNGEFYEVGTKLGAKRAATNAGSAVVGYRSNQSNMFVTRAVKRARDNKWHDVR